jgi:pimeloyl-ACP methyl ester carboxylesterase
MPGTRPGMTNETPRLLVYLIADIKSAPRMPIANVNACAFYYEIAGSGPDVIFIHGEDHSIALFERQIAHFAKSHRCIAYERRGHGRSQLTPYGYSLHNQTLDLTALLDYLQVRRCAIVAVAMATPIATCFALAHPERVAGLVMSSWYELDGYPLMEARRRNKHPSTFGEFHMREFEIMRDLGPKGLIELFLREGDALLPILPTDREVRERVVQMITSHAPEHFIKAAEYYTSMPCLTARLKEIACPILGICGTDDPSPDNPELLAGVRNFEQVWIPGARRFAMMEAPEAFNAAVERFLARLGW